MLLSKRRPLISWYNHNIGEVLMLNISLQEKEQILLEKHNVLIKIEIAPKLYDVIVTNKRILIYLNDILYDPRESSLKYGAGWVSFKDCYREISKSVIVKKEGSIIHLSNEEIYEFFDEDIERVI